MSAAASFLLYIGLSSLSQKSATVAEFGDCRRCLAVFCNSRTFLRQCGQCLTHLAVIFSFFTHLSTVGVTQRNARWRSVLFSKSYLYTQSLSACWANSQCRNGVGRLHLLDHAWRTAFAKRLAERTLTTSATSASAHLWATWLTYSVSARHSLHGATFAFLPAARHFNPTSSPVWFMLPF